jgi:uncharacterized protein (DUF1330 family)
MSVTDLNQVAIAALPDNTPVTMVNLVKFRRDKDGKAETGWKDYQKYSAAVIKLIKGCGGTVIWSGTVDGVALGKLADGDWDYVVMVRYPSRRAFLDMMISSAYLEANVHREAATENHVILAVSETYSKVSEIRS